MSACELVNLSGFVSKLNLMRIELPDQTHNDFEVGKYYKCNDRIVKIHRFCYSERMTKADVRFWRKNPHSACKNYMKMVRVDDLEHINTPDPLSLLRSFDRLPRKGL